MKQLSQIDTAIWFHSLKRHRSTVRKYIDDHLYNHVQWFKMGKKKRIELLQKYCNDIKTIDGISLDQHLEKFKLLNKEALTSKKHSNTYPIKVEVKKELSQQEEIHNPEEETFDREGFKKRKKIIKKFSHMCGNALTKTLTHMMAESNLNDESEVAEKLLNSQNFKEFLDDYANDFYLDVIEDGLLI